MISPNTWREMREAPSAVVELIRVLAARATPENIRSLRNAVTGEATVLPPAALVEEDPLTLLSRTLLDDASRRNTATDADMLCHEWAEAMAPEARQRSLYHHLMRLKADEPSERVGLLRNVRRLVLLGCDWREAQQPALDVLMHETTDHRGDVLTALFGPAPIEMPRLTTGESMLAAIEGQEVRGVTAGNALRVALLRHCGESARREAGSEFMALLERTLVNPQERDVGALLACLVGGVELDAKQCARLFAADLRGHWTVVRPEDADTNGMLTIVGAFARMRDLHGVRRAGLHQGLAERLHDLGADFDAPAIGTAGYPALHYAIVRGCLDGARAILACGADPRRGIGPDGTGATARELIDLRLQTQTRQGSVEQERWREFATEVDALNARGAARRALQVAP